MTPLRDDLRDWVERLEGAIEKSAAAERDAAHKEHVRLRDDTNQLRAEITALKALLITKPEYERDQAYRWAQLDLQLKPYRVVAGIIGSTLLVAATTAIWKLAPGLLKLLGSGV